MRVRAVIAPLAFRLICASPQPAPRFEVASVKVAPPRTGQAGLFTMSSDPAMVSYSNITLKMLTAIAYGFDSDRILGGPAWLDTQMYDVAAKLPPAASRGQAPAMLQTLLAERFKLVVHHQWRDQPVYFLVVGKSGPRLKPAQEPNADKQDLQQVRGDRLPGQIVRGGIAGRSLSMGWLASALSRVAGRQVVDRTGLTGAYDIDLKWLPEDAGGYGPDLFAAIQKQLGLKLEPGRAPVETLVIDQAQRDPTAN